METLRYKNWYLLYYVPTGMHKGPGAIIVTINNNNLIIVFIITGNLRDELVTHVVVFLDESARKNK